MLTIELHLCGSNSHPIRVNPNTIIFYESIEENHCRVWVYSGNESKMLEVEESYEKVKDILSRFEFVNENHWMAVQVGVAQYVDFLGKNEPNPLLNEYLKWKGRNEFISNNRYINADELLEYLGHDQFDSREKLIKLIESLIIKT